MVVVEQDAQVLSGNRAAPLFFRLEDKHPVVEIGVEPAMADEVQYVKFSPA